MYRGYTKAYRKEIESQIWLMPPLYHRVWYVLRQKAKYKPEVFPTRKEFGIHLNPGQLITSLRQICEWVSWVEWGIVKTPNVKTITTIICALESNRSIEVESNTFGTYINIVNWGIYNCQEEEKVTPKKREKVTRREQGPDTIKESKEVQIEKIYWPNFLIFWETYPKKIAKEKCFGLWKSKKLENGDFKKVMAALEEQKKSIQWKNQQYIPHPATWLSQERWQIEIEKKLENEWT